jgi:hypothetical protein
MGKGAGLLWLGGGLVAALLLVTRSAGAMVSHVEPSDDRAWVRRVIALVSATEGEADSLNRNLDGAGLSYGILQWNQRSGSLGVLLSAMAEADPPAFARLFGPSWASLLEATRRGGLAAVDGAPLWEEPWVSRFAAAGRHVMFVAVQWRLAEQGEHFRGALDAARILGVSTERAMALFFDRSVQQGPGAARQMAETLRASWAGRAVSYPEALQAFADLAASRFQRTSPPPTPYYSDRARHIVWKRVGAEWHAVAGRWDLYVDVVRRTRAILADRRLSDAQVRLEGP